METGPYEADVMFVIVDLNTLYRGATWPREEFQFVLGIFMFLHMFLDFLFRTCLLTAPLSCLFSFLLWLIHPSKPE